MKIVQSTLRIAMFRAIQDLATADALPVDVAELRASWAGTGLRRGDFAEALMDMLKKRFLSKRKSGSKVLVQITPSGLHEFHEPSSNALEVLLDWLRLKRIRMRKLESLVRRKRPRRRRSADTQR